MEKFSIDAIQQIVGGQLLQKGEVNDIAGVGIDSRKVEPEELYIPIIGENQDGHRFIPGAVENGAAAVLTMYPDTVCPSHVTVILVQDTVKAIQALAKANRERYNLPVAAVTGSSGKTTTKDVLAAVLSRQFKTMKTRGNFNNYLGVPQTMLQLDASYAAAVVETGMGRMGEIAETIDEIQPHYVVITNIGTAHLEFLGSRENILKAKMEALSTLTADDYAVLNGDDPWLDRIENVPYHIVRVGIDADDDHLDLKARALQSGADGITFEVDGELYHFRFPGRHNVYNCLAAIFIGRDLGLTPEAIQAGLDDFVPSGNRMRMEVISDITYIDDSYNANPDAMRAALNTLTDLAAEKHRKIAILGDMLEMGENAPRIHYEVGLYAGARVDVLIAVGPQAQAYVQGAKAVSDQIAIFHCKTAEDAGALLTHIAKAGDMVLIKASNGVGLKKIMQDIKGA